MLDRDLFFECLISCVLTQGKMGIPGFGTFVKERMAANPDPIAGVIHPPGNLFNLRSYQEGDGSINEAIAEKTGQNLEEITAFTNNLIQEWNQRLDNKEIVEIPDLGRIFREFTGELNFVQELSTSYSNPSNLPILPFKPIAREFGSRPVPSIPIKRITKAKGTSWSRLKSKLTQTEMLPITVAAASFILIVGIYFLLPKQVNFENQSITEKLPPAPVERVNQKPSHLPTATPVKDTIAEAKAKAADALLESEVEEVIDSSTEKVDKTLPSAPEIVLPKMKQGVIITGGYRNISGVKKKIDQIVSLGFNPYKDRKGDINRVGVQFSYQSEADIQRIMDKVQAEISPRAWLLIE